METCKEHIIAIDFPLAETPPVAITDDQPNPLAERVYCAFCPNCGTKLRESDSESRIYGLEGCEFIFNPADADEKRGYHIRLFRFCPNTGQFNGEVGKIIL